MSTAKPVFTPAQINHYRAYEAVRRKGQYNMNSRQAIKATGLSLDEYDFVKQNFAQLQLASQDPADDSTPRETPQ